MFTSIALAGVRPVDCNGGDDTVLGTVVDGSILAAFVAIGIAVVVVVGTVT